MAPDRCPICAAQHIESACVVGTTTIWQCRACGLGWWDASAHDFAGFYEKDYYSGGNASPDRGYADYRALRQGQHATARRRLARIRTFAPGAHTLLDVGCGLGYFLEQALEQGWGAAGFEISAYARETMKSAVNAPVHGPPLEGIAERFDVVTAWDVLEHVANPLDFLRTLGSLVTEGGAIVLTTGDFASLTARVSGRRWHLFNLPEHLFFHTPDSMRILARKAGLHVRRIHHPGAFYPVSYLCERVARKMGLSLKLPFAQQWNVPVNLFDIMEALLVRAPLGTGEAEWSAGQKSEERNRP